MAVPEARVDPLVLLRCRLLGNGRDVNWTNLWGNANCHRLPTDANLWSSGGTGAKPTTPAIVYFVTLKCLETLYSEQKTNK